MHHHLVCQQRQIVRLGLAQMPGPVIHDTECAEGLTVRGDQRGAGVEADTVRVGDHRVIGEAVVEPGIRNDQRAGAANGVVAERDVAFGFPDIKPDGRLEPLAVTVHQGDGGDRALAERRRALHDVVVFVFRGAVQNIVAGQAFQPGPLRL